MSDTFRILLAIDLQPGTERLVAEANRYAQALNATVDIVHVALPHDSTFEPYATRGTEEDLNSTRKADAQDLRTEHKQLQVIGAAMQQSGINVDHCLMIQGELPKAIFDHVEKFKSNLLILGAHHHSNLYRLWYGSTVADATKQTPCALLIVPA